MSENIKKVEKYSIYIFIFLLPIFLLPQFPNPFISGKIILVALVVGILLIVKNLEILKNKKLKIISGNFDFPIFLFLLTYLLSAYIITKNHADAFFLPGSASIIILGSLLYFLINQLEEKEKKSVKTSLFLSGTTLALILLLVTAGVFKNISLLPGFMRDLKFSPLGSQITTFIFLITILPFAIDKTIKEKEAALKGFWGVSSALIIFGSIIALINILPNKLESSRLPSFSVSWNIAVDSLKVSPVLGMGPGNYISAFNRFRPIGYNQTDLWRVRFTAARNFYLTVITETGLLGLSALTLMFVAGSKLFGKNSKEKKLVGWSTQDNSAIISLIILAGSLFLFPAEIVLICLLFILLSINAETNESNLNFGNNLSIVLISTIIILPLGYILYQGGNAALAEYKYKKSLEAASANKAQESYNLMQQAINQNPKVDRYHISYSQLNLALANVIAQKENLTEQDKTTLTQLIQQAIREGKNGVSLNPDKAENWEVLARIYQAVIPLAQGADQFAVETYKQAIALDPINPDLRLALGGVYYSQKSYDNAIKILELAVAAKPDHSNAHYNLAFALKEKGELERAINEMSVVLSLVEKDSRDYEVAKKNLEDFQAKKESEKKSSDNLTVPEQTAPGANPQIELPEGSEPPVVSEGEPTLSPSPSPVP